MYPYPERQLRVEEFDCQLPLDAPDKPDNILLAYPFPTPETKY